MMMNIFSMFDPSNYLMNLTMIPMIMYLLLLMKTKYKNSSMINMMNKLFSSKIKLTNMKFKNKKNLIISSSFHMMMFLNISSLLNMSFSNTSQLNNNMMFLMMWMSHFMFNMMKKTKKMLTHLTPKSTPNFLIPLIIMIEVMSQLLRPLTLLFRLTINMMAGHIMINLISKMSMKYKTSSIMLMLVMIMELMISLIQAYVFNMLINSYMEEI